MYWRIENAFNTFHINGEKKCVDSMFDYSYLINGEGMSYKLQEHSENANLIGQGSSLPQYQGTLMNYLNK